MIVRAAKRNKFKRKIVSITLIDTTMTIINEIKW